MVDVRTRVGDTAVMQKDDAAVLEVLLETRGDALFALTADRPCALVLGSLEPSEAGAHAAQADDVPALARPLLARGPSPLVLSSGACAGLPGLKP